MGKKPQLSIIIVNYNTKNDLQNCLASIYRSQQEIAYEVWVIDNNSPDTSVQMVEGEFPQVRLIKSATNLGFSKANNLAIRQTHTEFVLLLNPDTIVADHVFDNTVGYLSSHSEVGMVSCRLIKRDGTLDIACRRSFPSVFDGFCRAVGLSKMFPKSLLFARYNLTYLDEHRVSRVDAVNGAFMMVKRRAIEQVGLLDEDFFMYMEDLDWCFRFRKQGWEIYYDPSTTIYHLKGQSGKKDSKRMIAAFFESMEMFCRKNYLPRQTTLEYRITILGIRLWKNITLLKNALRKEKTVTP